MITDITGIVLTPGNCGVCCQGNGKHTDINGNIIECCCDECNYLICCTSNPHDILCKSCTNNECPNYLLSENK